MKNWLKRLFGREDTTELTRRIHAQHDERIEAQRIEEAERAAQAKAEWETRNELEKKIDACYLGTRRQAFYGTYEKWQAVRRQEALALHLYIPNQLQMLAPQQAEQMQNAPRNPYGISLFGSIFG